MQSPDIDCKDLQRMTHFPLLLSFLYSIWRLEPSEEEKGTTVLAGKGIRVCVDLVG